MLIRNQTHYRTDDLQSFFARVRKKAGIPEPEPFVVAYRPRGRSRGYKLLDPGLAVYLPRGARKLLPAVPPDDLQRAAAAFLRAAEDAFGPLAGDSEAPLAEALLVVLEAEAAFQEGAVRARAAAREPQQKEPSTDADEKRLAAIDEQIRQLRKERGPIARRIRYLKNERSRR